MRSPRIVGLFGSLIALVCTLTIPGRPLAAQLRGLCFRDRPRPTCRASILLTAAAYTPVLTSRFDDPNGTFKAALIPHSDFALGAVVNVGDRHGIGFGVGGGAGLSGRQREFERNEIHAIYRRWLGNGMAVDIAPGFVRQDVRRPDASRFPTRRSGGTLTVDLHYKHWAIATVRGDVMSGRDPNAKAVYVGFKVDGYTAVVGSALAAAAYFAAALAGS